MLSPTDSRCSALAICLATFLPFGLLATEAQATDIFAASFFPPDLSETSPLEGIFKINTSTGATTPFISLGTGGLASPTDIAIGPHDGALYVSSQNGSILYFDADTGVPLPSKVSGQPAGTFAILPTSGFGDAALSLLFDTDGTLNVATAFGSISAFNGTTGAQLADRATSLPPISGLERAPSGALLATTGNLAGGLGEMVSVTGGVATVIVSTGASTGIQDAGNPFILYADGDYDRNGIVELADYSIWESTYATSTLTADGNYDGQVDAIDFTIWRNNLDQEARILVADLHGNQIVSYALDGTDGQLFAEIPPTIPTPLPPTANPASPSNSPSEILFTEDGTLLLSTLGLTQRPDNRGSILEFDRQGNLLNTIASGLPPISGIAFVPPPIAQAVPEPCALGLLSLGTLAICFRRKSR